MNRLNTILTHTAGNIAPKGWILEFLQRDAGGITGYLDRLCPDASGDIFGRNKVKYEIRDWWSSWWPGETEGNWSEAYVRLALALQDPAMVQKAETIVNNLLLYQEDDGYIGIYQKNERYNNSRRSGELWTQSRAMLTLWAFYEVKGGEHIIKALTRLADNIIAHFGPLAGGRSLYEVPDEDGSKGHSLMIIEPMLMLFNLTGNTDYLHFCIFLYDDYSRHDATFPGSDMRMSNVLDPAVPFTSHGPHTSEQLRIPLLLYMATGNARYAEVFYAAVEKLKQNLSLSGSCKSDEMIGAYMLHIPENERIGNNLCGCPPLPTSGYEYCSTTELMFSFIWALSATGDMAFADMEEWMVMNAAMAAKQHDGKAIQYLCADNMYEAAKKIGDRWDYSPTHTDAAACCAPNSCKVMPYHLSRMWMHWDGNPAAVFYGPCSYAFTVGGQQITIDEDTIYPFEDTVRFSVKTENAAEFTLLLRIPGWCRGYSIDINGNHVKGENHKKGVVSVKRMWHNGDTLTLHLEHSIELLTAPDGSQALWYGPLLYSMKIQEQTDRYYSYEVEGFYDTNYTPEEGQSWDYTLVMSGNGSLTEASVITCPVQSYVWENPPVRLRTLMLNGWAMPDFKELMPIGCTLLRRTAFPVYTDKAGLFTGVTAKKP